MSQRHATTDNHAWVGDATTIATRARYTSNHREGLLPHAGALYAARSNRLYAHELFTLREELVQRAQELILTHSSLEPATDAELDQANALSLYLEWMVRHRVLTPDEHNHTESMVWILCNWAVSSSKMRRTDRFNPLVLYIRLTWARVALNGGSPYAVRLQLFRVATDLHLVRDRSLRADLYRELGVLYRKANVPIDGFLWGWKACCMVGVPFSVTLESFAALLRGGE